jgi:hypothetical protein
VRHGVNIFSEKSTPPPLHSSAPRLPLLAPPRTARRKQWILFPWTTLASMRQAAVRCGRRCTAMASDKTSDPSIQQYNVSHSDVIIHSSAIVFVTFKPLEFNSRCSDNRRTSEHGPEALLRAKRRLGCQRRSRTSGVLGFHFFPGLPWMLSMFSF